MQHRGHILLRIKSFDDAVRQAQRTFQVEYTVVSLEAHQDIHKVRHVTEARFAAGRLITAPSTRFDYTSSGPRIQGMSA